MGTEASQLESVGEVGGLINGAVDFSSQNSVAAPYEQTIDQKLARLGELTTFITLISPLPSFIFCHKRSFEKNQQLERISFNFLLAMFVTNLIWLAYSLKIMNMDLIIVNGIGSLIASVWVSLYLYVKYKVSRHMEHLPRLCCSIIFAILSSSGLTDPWTNGLIATTMSMTQYVFILEGVKGVLQTKDPARVDLIIAVACICNSLAWGCYAQIVGDIFVFIPNVAAMGAGVINVFLFMWTTGKMRDNAMPIKILHKCCNKKARVLPSKVKDEKELESEGLFTTMNPEDSNSHGSILRDQVRKRADSSSSDDENGKDASFQVHIDGAAKPRKSKKHVV